MSFITTAIDYPNALPHIGTAFEKLGADVYARFRRSQGRDVYFLMGNDENTAKVKKAADAVQQGDEFGPQVYADKMALAFKAIWKELDISFDDFIQTSEARHRIGVQKFIIRVNEAGYIDKRLFKGLYCEGCEEYKTPNSTVDGKCPYHSSPLVQREEENYFFQLSKFKDRVLDLLRKNLRVEPESRWKEIVNFVENDLRDISISRKNEGWGIPIPWDATQVTYVWFDALLNYLTGIGFGTDQQKFEKFWPAEVHFIGKDITRFHCALFPAMCMAYNEGCKISGESEIKLPTKVFAHGFVYQRKGDVLVRESKTEKSVTPMELVSQFGVDAFRYYFLAKLNYESDGEYSVDHFKEVYTADLTNNLGNLASRVVALILRYFGKIPDQKVGKIWVTPKDLKEYENLISACKFKQAIEIVWKIVDEANLYVENQKPWSLIHKDTVKCETVLWELAGSLRVISLMLRPFLPSTAKKIYESFRWSNFWSQAQWNYLKNLGEDNYRGMDVEINQDFLVEGKYPGLFPRIL